MLHNINEDFSNNACSWGFVTLHNDLAFYLDIELDFVTIGPYNCFDNIKIFT